MAEKAGKSLDRSEQQAEPAAPKGPEGPEDVPSPTVEYKPFDREEAKTWTQSSKTTKKEKDVLDSYIVAKYDSINGKLRGTLGKNTDPEFVQELDDDIEVLDKLMMPLPSDITATRFTENFVFPENTKEGDLWSDPGFVSTTITQDEDKLKDLYSEMVDWNPEEDYSEGVKITFRVPAGTRARYLEPYTKGLSAEEEELLLDRGLQFRVVSVERGKNGISGVTLEVAHTGTKDTTPPVDEPNATEPSLPKGVADFKESEEDGFPIIDAVDKNGIRVGRLVISWEPIGGTADEPVTAPFVHDIDVKDKFRGRGIASAMVAKAREKYPDLRHHTDAASLTPEGEGFALSDLKKQAASLEPGPMLDRVKADIAAIQKDEPKSEPEPTTAPDWVDAKEISGVPHVVIKTTKKKEPTPFPPGQPIPGTHYQGEDKPTEAMTYDEAGHTHWGTLGAAGTFVIHTDPDGTRHFLMQQRSPDVESPNTWSTPGGAIKPGQNPVDAALEETSEEMGIMADQVTPVKAVTDDHGGWAYTTVISEAPSMDIGDVSDWESSGFKWVTEDELGKLDLHPGFKRSWDMVKKELPAAPKPKKPAKKAATPPATPPPTSLTFKEMAHDDAKDWYQATKVPEKQKQALEIYMDDGFRAINDYLRGGDTKPGEDVTRGLEPGLYDGLTARMAVKLMDDSMKPLPQDITVARFVDQHDAFDMLESGGTFRDDGYMSTTIKLDEEHLKDVGGAFMGQDGVEIRINVPAGTKAAYIGEGGTDGFGEPAMWDREPDGSYSVVERELILQRGLEMEVGTLVTHPDGSPAYIEFNVVPPKTTTAKPSTTKDWTPAEGTGDQFADPTTRGGDGPLPFGYSVGQKVEWLGGIGIKTVEVVGENDKGGKVKIRVDYEHMSKPSFYDVDSNEIRPQSNFIPKPTKTVEPTVASASDLTLDDLNFPKDQRKRLNQLVKNSRVTLDKQNAAGPEHSQNIADLSILRDQGYMSAGRAMGFSQAEATEAKEAIDDAFGSWTMAGGFDEQRFDLHEAMKHLRDGNPPETPLQRGLLMMRAYNRAVWRQKYGGDVPVTAVRVLSGNYATRLRAMEHIARATGRDWKLNQYDMSSWAVPEAEDRLVRNWLRGQQGALIKKEFHPDEMWLNVWGEPGVRSWGVKAPGEIIVDDRTPLTSDNVDVTYMDYEPQPGTFGGGRNEANEANIKAWAELADVSPDAVAAVELMNRQEGIAFDVLPQDVIDHVHDYQENVRHHMWSRYLWDPDHVPKYQIDQNDGKDPYEADRKKIIKMLKVIDYHDLDIGQLQQESIPVHRAQDTLVDLFMREQGWGGWGSMSYGDDTLEVRRAKHAQEIKYYREGSKKILDFLEKLLLANHTKAEAQEIMGRVISRAEARTESIIKRLEGGENMVSWEKMG